MGERKPMNFFVFLVIVVSLLIGGFMVMISVKEKDAPTLRRETPRAIDATPSPSPTTSPRRMIEVPPIRKERNK
jgi:hypothetical protein